MYVYVYVYISVHVGVGVGVGAHERASDDAVYGTLGSVCM